MLDHWIDSLGFCRRRAIFLAVLSLAPNAFSQDAAVLTFDWSAAKARAKLLGHPRSFPATPETEAIFQAAISGERRVAFAGLLARVEKRRGTSRVSGVASVVAAAKTPEQIARLVVEIKSHVYEEVRATHEAGFTALATRSGAHRSDAMSRIRGLVALNPRAETSVATEDLSAMLVARTLALGLDWFYPHWSVEERQSIVGAIGVRMEDFAQKLVRGPKPLEKNPLVSHDNEVLGALAEIAVLLLGETPQADRWFDEFVPLYARILTPFGGDDGGYANGTAYASWDVGEYSLLHWDILRRSIGLDLTQKTWVRNFGRFQAYFIPPGTPAGVFGNGAELVMTETWARYAKAYALRVPSPLSRWYARQWFQEDASRLELMMAPVPAAADAGFPPDTPNAAMFPSIGWSAHHSSLQDRGRTSMYFKSSPYGAVSHSHSDQNSFVLNSAGKQLLIDSGYYDYFGSPHHFRWTKRTVAHNAITFNGGQGQEDEARPWGTEAAKGAIVQFSSAADIDFVVGDATPAYRGKLLQAKRAVVYLRPDAFVVIDRVESAEPRTWEWNLHALNRFEAGDSNTLTVSNGDARACVSFIGSTETQFQQTNAFPVAPMRTASEPRPDQWHGQFVTRSASVRFWSAALIRVGCVPLSMNVRFGPSSASVTIGQREFEFDGQKIVVRR